MGTILEPLVLEDTLRDLRTQVQELDLKIRRDTSPPCSTQKQHIQPRTLPPLHLQPSERPLGVASRARIVADSSTTADAAYSAAYSALRPFTYSTDECDDSAVCAYSAAYSAATEIEESADMTAVDSAAEKILTSLGKNGFNSTCPYDDVRVVLARYEECIDTILEEEDEDIDPIGLVACILEPQIISKMHRCLQRGYFSADSSDLDSPIEWEKVKDWLISKYSRFDSDSECVETMKDLFYEVMPGSIAFSSVLVLQDKLAKIDVLAESQKDHSFDGEEFANFMKTQFPIESRECDIQDVDTIDKVGETLQQLFVVSKRILSVMLGQDGDEYEDDY